MAIVYSQEKGQVLEEVLGVICKYLRDQEVSEIDDCLKDKLKLLERQRREPIRISDNPSECEMLIKRLLCEG